MMSGITRRLLLSAVRLLVGAHARWDGCAPDGGRRIYFANHSSHLDSLAVLAALPANVARTAHPVAARDYWGRSAFPRFIAEGCLGAVLIDRNPRGSKDPLAPMVEILERGESLILFPEGTRGGSEIDDFKSGLFHLARRVPEAEIVPVYLNNLHRVLPKGTALIVPLITSLRVGAPLVRRDGEGKTAFLDRARDALAGLAPETTLKEANG